MNRSGFVTRWSSVAKVEEEDPRSLLQERLVLLSKVLFWGLGGMLVFSGELVYELYPHIRPTLASHIFFGSAAGVAILGLIWQLVLVGREPSERVLRVVDIAYAGGCGIGLAASAYFAPELRATSYTALLLSIFVVITRAIVVPSTASRTAAMAALTFAPITIAALGLAWRHTQDVPGPAFTAGALVLTSVAAALATVGSGVMYGLRRQADAAIRFGQYTLDRKLGEGGMGVVYRAHHVLLRRPTAIKLLAPERHGADALDRFEREVQHTSQLTHPNTVAVFDYGRATDGTFYYAMEYLDGIDLEQLVQRYGAQSPGRVVRLLAQVCGALQEAHDCGIIHRDVKPANIIACDRGAVPDVAKVVDFGLVTEIARDVNSTTAKIVGTLAYIPPEAITSTARLGPAADLYALGCVGYFLLAGRRPFEGATVLDTCVQHATAAPPPLAAPAALAAVILRCLAKRPDERYASASELADALRAADPGDWDEDRARAWWSEHAAQQARGVSRLPTQTVTMQIQGRP